MSEKNKNDGQVHAASVLRNNPLGSTQLTLVRSKFDSPKLSSGHRLSARIDDIIPDLEKQEMTLRADYQIGSQPAPSPTVQQPHDPSPVSNMQRGSVNIASLLDSNTQKEAK